MKKCDKTKAIASEYSRLLEVYLNTSSDPTATELLCGRAAEMKVTLDELEARIQAEGPVIKDMTGNGYEVTKENPAQKSYNVTIKNYNAVLRRLSELSGRDRNISNPVLEYIDS